MAFLISCRESTPAGTPRRDHPWYVCLQRGRLLLRQKYQDPVFPCSGRLPVVLQLAVGSFLLWKMLQEDYKQRTLKLLQKDFKTIQCILSKLC